MRMINTSIDVCFCTHLIEKNKCRILQIVFEAIVGSIFHRSLEPDVHSSPKRHSRGGARATSFPGSLILPFPLSPRDERGGGKMRYPGNEVGARAPFPTAGNRAYFEARFAIPRPLDQLIN